MSAGQEAIENMDVPSEHVEQADEEIIETALPSSEIIKVNEVKKRKKRNGWFFRENYMINGRQKSSTKKQSHRGTCFYSD